MNTWRKIYNQKIQEGLSDDFAYKQATKVMNERRESFNPHTIIGWK